MCMAGAFAGLLMPAAGATRVLPAADSLLEDHLLVTWYGNPHSSQMGVLGQSTGAARVTALRRQAAAYVPLTRKTVVPAYQLVAVVAQPTAGADGKWRRRESFDVIRALLDEARANGLLLVLDVQSGHARIEDEIEHLRPFLLEPDVHLALDPEFDMSDVQVPGRHLGHTHAIDINRALDALEGIVGSRGLPPKVVIIHQFTLAMLPDKPEIRQRPRIDLVLDMDGFGSQALKLSSYRAIVRQCALTFAGFKLFYRQDTNLFSPQQVMRLSPAPSVVIYQ